MIESISAGTPVIACTGSVLEEAGGPGAIYIDPDDADSYAQTAEKIICDTDYRRQLVEAGQAYIARFSHKTMATQIIATYDRALH